ncbi:hypothetical protein A2368_04110 [Candidatus Collierbacteria bacterium RIFOXYB1_FULL_49_13]|uniref:Uncharacterized protein n=1 Tax=Candidatus Collierbacteria bacterium RIFOXYB1_FULL_49_13 TaxID=1817728 RepID=A0A1F5FHW2_9BACT|nr:MAG: hypothetical protein A2368_04110 [Candidatus Collierbacteria bacterium RIFOXYB1_FULL_49_13]
MNKKPAHNPEPVTCHPEPVTCHPERSRGISPLRFAPVEMTLAFVVFSIVCLFQPKFASAQADIPLTISPARQGININPGESSSYILKLINPGLAPVSGTIKAVDFTVTDNQGTPELLDDAIIPSDYSGAAWIRLNTNRVTVAAGGKVEIPYRVVAPQDALPGGHYVAIVFEVTSDLPSGDARANQSAAGAIAPRIAELLYITIPGDITESAQVTQFLAPNFQEYGPVQIDTTIANSSSIHIRPTGVITVTNMFGDVVAHLPLTEVNVFPNASRVYANILPGKWHFGRFKAELQAAYGTQGETLNAVIYFTVFPVTIAVIVLSILIILAIIIYMFIKRNQKHEQALETEVEQLREQLQTKYKDPRPQV